MQHWSIISHSYLCNHNLDILLVYVAIDQYRNKQMDTYKNRHSQHFVFRVMTWQTDGDFLRVSLWWNKK
jgi:hypothetical protein